MKRLALIILCLCLLLTACGRKADCPAEVIHAIDDYLAEKYSDYTLDAVDERSDLIYSFTYTETHFVPLAIPATSENAASSSEEIYETRSHTDYVYCIDGQWKITNNFGSIPGHILRGEVKDTSPSPAQDCPEEVLDTFSRWRDNLSIDGDGDWDTHVDLCYWGEESAPSYPGISINTALTWDINSVTRVNDELYEIISTVTDKYMDEPITYQHFVGLIDGEWKIMFYELIPEYLHEGLETFDEYRFTEDGIEIIPAK